MKFEAVYVTERRYGRRKRGKTMRKEKTNWITLLSAVIVLGALVYGVTDVPSNISASDLTTFTNAEQRDAIEAFLTERDEVRKMEILQLNAIAEDESAETEVRMQARRQLLALTDSMEKESTIEGILRIKGFSDPVVAVHANSVNVIVRASSLSQSQSAQILELAMRETGQTGGNVKIMYVS